MWSQGVKCIHSAPKSVWKYYIVGASTHSLTFPLVLCGGLFRLQGVKHRPLARTEVKDQLPCTKVSTVSFTASVFLHNNGSPSFLHEASAVFWRAAIRPFPRINLVRIPPDSYSPNYYKEPSKSIPEHLNLKNLT